MTYVFIFIDTWAIIGLLLHIALMFTDSEYRESLDEIERERGALRYYHCIAVTVLFWPEVMTFVWRRWR